MATTDLILPFQLDVPQLRGRIIRLGSALDGIVKRHDYPLPVATLLAETLTLAALLAGMLKYKGVFTLQAKGDGAVTMLVADISTEGALRGYAQFDTNHEIFRAGPSSSEAVESSAQTARELLNDGHLAFTVDQGLEDRYQGIVELAGDTLADFVQHYFRQSEQIDTGFEIAAMKTSTGWRAGGIMLQRLPEAATPIKANEEDDWRRAMILLDSVTPHELTDPALSTEDLLFRLFHDEEVRVFEAQELEDKCRCSKDRVEGMLKALPPEEIAAMKADKGAEVKCEFCGRDYVFSVEALSKLKTTP